MGELLEMELWPYSHAESKLKNGRHRCIIKEKHNTYAPGRTRVDHDRLYKELFKIY